MEEIQENKETTPKIVPTVKDILSNTSKQVSSLEHSRNEFQIQMTRFKGPLPHPDLLKQYKEIQNDFPERLLCLVEKQSNERHDLNKRIVNISFILQLTGQIFGFLAVLSAIVGGIVISVYGHFVSGNILSFGGLALLGSAFVKNYFQTKKKNKRKK